MHHFLYAVNSNSPAPQGGGDAASWLRYYKLQENDEVFVPMVPGLETIQPGDMLWFSIDGELQSAVIVLRVLDDHLNDKIEIWFDGTQLRHVTTKTEWMGSTGPIEERLAQTWMGSLELI